MNDDFTHVETALRGRLVEIASLDSADEPMVMYGRLKAINAAFVWLAEPHTLDLDTSEAIDDPHAPEELIMPWPRVIAIGVKREA